MFHYEVDDNQANRVQKEARKLKFRSSRSLIVLSAITSGITGFAIALSQIYRCPATFRSPSAQSPVHAFVMRSFVVEIALCFISFAFRYSASSVLISRSRSDSVRLFLVSKMPVKLRS